jgi:xanthine dehydrogenase accessory factor
LSSLIYAKLNALIESKMSGILVTVVAGRTENLIPGKKFLVDEKGELLQGEVTEELLILLQEPMHEVLTTKKPIKAQVNYQDKPIQIFLDPVFPTARLIILGGGHIALPLVSMGKILNYEVTVVDDRPSFANSGRFPEANYVICEEFKKALQEIHFDANTYVIIVTRGHRHDQTCLEEILKKPQIAYTGMIGSRRKVATLLGVLKEKGFPEERINQVYTPIGLDIGAQTPEEIAVSIMAEIIMVNRYGYSQGLKTGRCDKPRQGGIQLGS